MQMQQAADPSQTARSDPTGEQGPVVADTVRNEDRVERRLAMRRPAECGTLETAEGLRGD